MNSETTKGTRDQSLSDLLHSWKFSSWKFMKPRLNGGRRSTCASNSALLPSNAIDFAMLSAQRFWRETVSLLDVVWPRSNQWERALLGKSIQLYNNKNRPFALRSHVTSFSMKMKVIWFCVQKTISDLVFQTRTIFLKCQSVRSWSRVQNVIFETMNYRIYSNKRPTSNKRPPRISAHPKGRKS